MPESVTKRAKAVLKAIESGDITAAEVRTEENEVALTPQLAEVEKILKDLDLNNLSPMQAFIVLGDLVEKVK